jgi:RNA-directed DNA polymerase
VDRLTFAFVEETYGVQRLLHELERDLRIGLYRPAPARRVDIPKPAGASRPLGIPTVRDRVAQAAAKIVLEPIFEADLPRVRMSSGRNVRRQAKEAIRVAFIQGYTQAAEADIRDFFGSIDHDRLMVEMGRRGSDRRVLNCQLVAPGGPRRVGGVWPHAGSHPPTCVARHCITIAWRKSSSRE